MKHLRGQRLIGWTIEQAQQVGIFDNIIVSTDSEEIADYARAWKAEVQMRPKGLAADESSKWDVFRYIAEHNPCEIMVDLDTGCPLRSPQDITRTIAKLKEGYGVVATAYKSERNPYFNMVKKRFPVRRETKEYYDLVCGSNGVVVRRQDAPEVWSLSPSVFAITADALFNYPHWSRAKLGILEVPRRRGIDIDTPDDWDYVEWLLWKDGR